MKISTAFLLTAATVAFSGMEAVAQQAPAAQPAVTQPAAPAVEAPANKPAAETSNVRADRKVPDTLMFSIDELNDIQSRVAAGGQGKSDSQKGPSDAIEKASLYLSTIVYYGPTDWTIWINGVPIGPHENFQSFKVTSIGPRYVELLVPLSAQGVVPVHLEPNQTFLTKSGAVVEGPWN